MDPLSDVLRAVRLSGAYFYHVEAAAPWAVSAHPALDRTPRIMPHADHVIPYHIVTEGECWAGLRGEEPVRIMRGDVIVFPQGDAHLMGSQLEGIEPVEQTGRPVRFPVTTRVGPALPAETQFVCGFLGCDVRPFNPLLSSLPRFIHLRGFASGWLADFPRQVVAESRQARAGAESMLARMAELMFVECIRQHIETVSDQRTGWLAALGDPVVGRALELLHERPAEQWTLAELAREAASSRTVLAERFNEVVGMPPMQYLTMWRLQLAAEQLMNGTAKVATVGATVGYESEAAFSRAFKRATGLSPAQWRRAKREGEALPGPAA